MYSTTCDANCLQHRISVCEKDAKKFVFRFTYEHILTMKMVNYGGYVAGVIFFIGEDDLQSIATELRDMSDVEPLALSLGIRMTAWLRIASEHPQQVETQKRRVLYHWLKRMEIIGSKQSERPSWAGLAEAVAGFDPMLSERIRRQHC